MVTIRLADAKAQLSAVIDRVEAGETICLTRRGKPVAQIVPVAQPVQPFDWDELKQFTATLTYQEEGAGDFMRRIRDEERY